MKKLVKRLIKKLKKKKEVKNVTIDIENLKIHWEYYEDYGSKEDVIINEDIVY